MRAYLLMVLPALLLLPVHRAQANAELFDEVRTRLEEADTASFDTGFALFSDRKDELADDPIGLGRLAFAFASCSRHGFISKDQDRLLRCAEGATWCAKAALAAADAGDVEESAWLAVAEMEAAGAWTNFKGAARSVEDQKALSKSAVEHLGRLREAGFAQEGTARMAFVAARTAWFIGLMAGAGEFAPAAQAGFVQELVGEVLGREDVGAAEAEFPVLGDTLAFAAANLRSARFDDPADKLETAAVGVYTLVVSGKDVPARILARLAALHTNRMNREPEKFVEHADEAIRLYERAIRTTDGGANLQFLYADCLRTLGAVLDLKLAADPKNRKLEKSCQRCFGAALDAYAQVLEATPDLKNLPTAYNECLWDVKRLTKGREKREPIMSPQQIPGGKISFAIPVSTKWEVPRIRLTGQDVWRGVRNDKDEAERLILTVARFKWDTNYVVPDTGEKIGGDNIGGLARFDEADLRAYFQDVKERRPLRTAPLNRRIPKAEIFSVEGLTESGSVSSWKVIFFKHSKAMATFRITIIASPGLLDRNPYELEAILDSFELKD